jgi:hypothetical protein
MARFPRCRRYIRTRAALHARRRSGLSDPPWVRADLAAGQHIGADGQHVSRRGQHIGRRDRHIGRRDRHIGRQSQRKRRTRRQRARRSGGGSACYCGVLESAGRRRRRRSGRHPEGEPRRERRVSWLPRRRRLHRRGARGLLSQRLERGGSRLAGRRLRQRQPVHQVPAAGVSHVPDPRSSRGPVRGADPPVHDGAAVELCGAATESPVELSGATQAWAREPRGVTTTDSQHCTRPAALDLLLVTARKPQRRGLRSS